MTKTFSGYNKLRRIIERGETPLNEDLYLDDLLEILYILYNEDSCRACKSIENLTIDHIKPRARGGSRRRLKNLQILCFNCNNIKADLLPGKNGWWPDEISLPPNSAL
jgi:5-methylcytosine-specific restriction endonuclease McrA